MPHFRTASLREIGGWDAHNVTEDADLGMRLARFGYRADVISSTTYEEAPARIGSWLRQRTRWFKGWMRSVSKIISYLITMSYIQVDARPIQHRNIVATVLLGRHYH